MSPLTSKKLFVLASALFRTPGIAACNSTETLILDDGRTLAYCQYGANRTESDGIKTVIHNNGSGGSRLEWPGDEKMLIRHNISFVSVDRPGHGMSDYQANRTLLGWADDIRQLADHLAIDQFYVEGWSAGGSYALAIAHELQDRVIKGVTLSGIGPYDRPNPYDGLPNVQMLTWMRDAREGNLTALLAFRELMAGMLSNLTAAEVGTMLAAAGGGVDDEEVAQRPDLQQLMGANILEGYAQGYEGPAWDDLVINQPWGFYLQNITVPFDVWQGENDTNVPMNQGVYQSQILNNSRLILLENTAHLFPLTSWEQILVELTSEGEIIDTTNTFATDAPTTSNAEQNVTSGAQSDDSTATSEIETDSTETQDKSSSIKTAVGAFFLLVDAVIAVSVV